MMWMRCASAPIASPRASSGWDHDAAAAAAARAARRRGAGALSRRRPDRREPCDAAAALGPRIAAAPPQVRDAAARRAPAARPDGTRPDLGEGGPGAVD